MKPSTAEPCNKAPAVDRQRPPRLEMRGIRKRFGATQALQGVELSVNAGEVVALIGENGAGKSTLMKVLSGAHLPDAGEMRLDGESYAPRTPQDARQAGVAMIYQEISLASHLTIEENISLGIEPVRFGLLKKQSIRRRAMDALEQLGHGGLDPRTPAGSLPIALQQIVEIARALTMKCRVLVLDEPTSSLTREDTECLFRLIDRLKDQQLGIVYISHFIEETRRVANRFFALRDGLTVGSGVMSETTTREIIALMAGREINQLYHRTPRMAGETILSVTNLGGRISPQSASLELRRGEVLGIAGLVGAGRTELLRVLFGLDPIRRGSVRLGIHAGAASPMRRWRQRMGFLSENRKEEGLALELSIAENMTLPCLRGLGPLNLVLPSRQDQAAMHWIEELGIRSRSPRQSTGELSGGNQQKTALARLLYHDVDVLLLDEPTRGIDVGAKALIYRLLDEMVAGRLTGRPCAVLLVSSHLPELLNVCDRVAVMRRGCLGPARPTETLDEHELLMEATRS